MPTVYRYCYGCGTQLTPPLDDNTGAEADLKALRSATKSLVFELEQTPARDLPFRVPNHMYNLRKLLEETD